MSSSLRNVVHRRNHKERGQLAGRERLGLLEKKKDYLLRARDYHSKQRRLKALREKALFRNPDEFYFKMINSKTEKGVHIQERNNQLPDEMVQLMKSQDRNYIRMHRDISKKKMEKIRDSLHFLDEAIDGDKADDGLAIYDGEEEQEDEESKPAPKKNTHIVFVDSEQEAKEFDPVKHLDTAPELVNRKFNRPRLETLKKTPIQAFASPADLKALRKEREAKYKEYAARLKREEDLRKVERELVIQKELRKGAKKKVGVDEYGLPIYKWRGDRKK